MLPYASGSNDYSCHICLFEQRLMPYAVLVLDNSYLQKLPYAAVNSIKAALCSCDQRFMSCERCFRLGIDRRRSATLFILKQHRFDAKRTILFSLNEQPN